MDTLKLMDVWNDLIDIKASIAYIIKNIEEERYENYMDIHKDILEEHDRLNALTASIYTHFQSKHAEEDEAEAE